MVARYGRQWTEKWPDDRARRLAIAEWSDRLSDVTDEQIIGGLDEWHGKWPPNVEEFRSLCLGCDKSWEHGGDAYKPFRPMLPKPKAKKSVADANLEKMRSALAEAKAKLPKRERADLDVKVQHGHLMDANAVRCPKCNSPALDTWGFCGVCSAPLGKQEEMNNESEI